MSIAPGTRLGPYEIVAPVGAGGMGEVYRALDTRLDRIVAIKTLRGECGARFQREARAIAAMNHPHICQLYDVGPDYLVMEFIEGTPLHGPLAAPQAVAYALQICAALETAHAKNIIHRDLKPGNILITASGAKLLDFGLAKIDASAAQASNDSTALGLTGAGTVLGSTAYMSPEQAKGEEADARSDIFSFGLVLYEMLSGRRAFSQASTMETIAAILRDEPAPLDAPRKLAAIVARCLQKSPAARFQTMSEVRSALEQTSGASDSIDPSIAVLPFVNMSADKENEYFSDGLAEEIINALAQMRGLKVIARTSAFAFRGKDQDIRSIAGMLGVSTILEGSVRRAGNRIRVTAQLIEAENGSHLWSARYDREMADVFAVQDEIAGAIATALEVRLALASATRRQYTPSLPAYEAYLRARYHWGKATPDGLARSKECFEQAAALDPQFALAYVGLADYFLLLTVGSGVMPAHEAMPRVREFARRALDIDPAISEAHAMLGIVAGVYDYDWNEARRLFATAMTREPISPLVRLWYGHFHLLPMGRFAESAVVMQAGLHEDPLNSIFRSCFADVLGAAGKYEAACAQCRQVLETDENFFYACVTLALNLVALGRIPDAIGAAEKAHALAPWNTLCVATLAAALRLAGEASRSEELLLNLRASPEAYGSPRGLLLFHALCGEDEEARRWTAKAVEQRDYYGAMFAERFFRSGSHWRELAKMINLPEPT